MVDTKRLDAVLAEWRDATTPLDGKMSVDPSFFLPSSSTSSSISTSSSLALRSKATTRTTAAIVKHEERKSDDNADDEGKEERALTLLRVGVEKSCRPWSHEDFLKRVSSFSVGTWFAKPDAISVFACARHGWINTAQPDQLYCPCCAQYLCFKIDEKLSEKGVLQVAGAFAKLLATGHSSLCPWRENPSPDAFTTLPIASPKQVLASLEKRIEQILASCPGDNLFDLLSTLRIDGSVMKKILQETSTADEASSSLTTEMFQKVLVTKFEDLIGTNAHEASNKDSIPEFLLHVTLLSVCGWQLEQQQQQQQPGNAASAVAWCETCNRRWSMSSFSAESSPSDQSSVDTDDGECVERNAKRQKVAHPAAVDLVAQHRWFCPWVAARKPEASHELGVMSDELAKYGENDAKLWEFMLLPGWKQYAQALRLLLVASSSGLSKNKKNDASEKAEQANKQVAAKPEQALESVRAVLGLPDW